MKEIDAEGEEVAGTTLRMVEEMLTKLSICCVGLIFFLTSMLVCLRLTRVYEFCSKKSTHRTEHRV